MSQYDDSQSTSEVPKYQSPEVDKYRKYKHTKAQKTIIVILLSITAIILLLPIIWIFIFAAKMLPGPDRFGEINHVLEVIDYREAGEIIEEKYSGAGGISPVYFDATIKGEEAFDSLKNKAIAFYGSEKCTQSDGYLRCAGQLSVSVKNGETSVKIEDN